MQTPQRGTGKQPKQGPYGAKPTLCNDRLNLHSETIPDDDQVNVAKRCIFLLGGENDVEEVPSEKAHPTQKKAAIMRNNAIFLELSANAFADPKIARKAEIMVQLSTLLIEICPDVIKNMTMIMPDFRPLFRYDD